MAFHLNKLEKNGCHKWSCNAGKKITHSLDIYTVYNVPGLNIPKKTQTKIHPNNDVIINYC